MNFKCYTKTPVTGMVLFLFMLFTVFGSAAFAAQKNLTLQNIEGQWELDIEKSKLNVKTVKSMLNDYKGFKFTISAKNKTIRMQWPGFDHKTHKLTVVKATPAELHCKLDGFAQNMIIEKSTQNELKVKDRDETLTFKRVKTK